MNISFVKLLIVLISLSIFSSTYTTNFGDKIFDDMKSQVAGSDTADKSSIDKVKDSQFKHFKFGTTFDECKKQLSDYDIKTRWNEEIRIEKYMTYKGKEVSLTLFFSDELVIDKDMVSLDDYRLYFYSYGITGVDYNFNKEVIQYFSNLYGKPVENDFFEKDAEKNVARHANWEKDDFIFSVSDYTGNEDNKKNFISMGFKINEKERQRFKNYIE